jgi:hypothetical protein
LAVRGADTFLIGAIATGNVRVLAASASGTDRIWLISTTLKVGTSLDASEIVTGTASTTADQRDLLRGHRAAVL